MFVSTHLDPIPSIQEFLCHLQTFLMTTIPSTHVSCLKVCIHAKSWSSFNKYFIEFQCLSFLAKILSYTIDNPHFECNNHNVFYVYWWPLSPVLPSRGKRTMEWTIMLIHCRKMKLFDAKFMVTCSMRWTMNLDVMQWYWKR